MEQDTARRALVGLLLFGCLSVVLAAGKAYHVRTDGGTAAQCTGLHDSAYLGVGTGMPCAWSGPMIALPPTGPARIAGGDTLLIHKGQYPTGLGSPGADGCNQAYPWDCNMQALPSGPDVATPTRVLGDGHEGACRAAVTQLWGNEHSSHVLSLKGTSNAELACLEITDHAGCVEHHSGGLACNRDKYPYGGWAANGIVASDSRNVLLRQLDIHGMANRGILAGRLTDWTVDRVRIAANGWAGWDGDVSSDGSGKGSSNSGTLRFTKWLVEWNGCAETYPGKKPAGCWAQSVGGYGDGVGTGETGGNWVIEDSRFRYNTSDGLDLLYKAAGTVTLNRVRARGNAGNQVKVSGTSSVTNSLIIGDCGHFSGKPYTHQVDACRAAGDALVLVANAATDVLAVTNNTILSQGNVIILARGPTGSVLKLRNNILVGQPMVLWPSQTSADTYLDNTAKPGMTIDESHALKQTLRSAVCTTPSTICGDAGLTSLAGAINPRPKVGSRAINSGTPAGAPPLDLYGAPRVRATAIDRGAIEQQ